MYYDNSIFVNIICYYRVRIFKYTHIYITLIGRLLLNFPERQDKIRIQVGKFINGVVRVLSSFL